MSRLDAVAAQSTSARWLLALRVSTLLAAAMVLMQGVSAGQLVGAGEGLGMHQVGAILVHVTAAAQLASAFLLWRSDRGPRWPMIVSALALVLGFIQAAIGEAGNMKIHVPVALALTMTVAAVVAWAWWPGRGEVPAYR